MTISARKGALGTISAILILVIVFISMSQSQKHFSPVYDEIANIPSGYNFLLTGRYTDATHPPFYRYLLSVPLFVQDADPLIHDEKGGYSWQEYGKNFLFQNKLPWQQILTGSRTVVILTSLLLLALLYWWTKKLWGPGPALAALVFLAFEPSFLAHGQLATLDMGFALLFFIGVYALHQYILHPDWRRFWGLNLATGLAFMTKFTAISLFVSGFLCLLLFRKKQKVELKRFWLTPILSSLIIFVTYQFEMKPAKDDAIITHAPKPELVQSKIIEIAAALGTDKETMMSAKIPAYDFWKGFGMQAFHAMFQDQWGKKDSFQYLRGEYERRGWHTYFMWTFLFKSTLATLLMLLLLGALNVQKILAKSGQVTISGACLVISPAVLFLLCSLGTINIGHRYILPVYPFLAMGVGYLFSLKKPWLQYSVVGLLALHVVSSCAVWPHHLSYFNELSRGGYYLSDSNIDWGQDLLYVKNDVAQFDTTTVAVYGDLFGLVRPENLGFHLNEIPKSGPDSLKANKNIIYLSVNRYLNRNEIYPEGIYPWLNVQQPTRKVGTSILVFEVLR